MKEKILTHFRNDFQRFYRKYLLDIKATNGDEYQALCPFHDDTKPSFNFNNESGKWFCHGCKKSGDIFGFYARKMNMDTRTDFKAILKGINNDFRILQEERESHIIKTYDYMDAGGNLLYQVCRMEPKDFRIRRPGKDKNWIWSLKGVNPVLYRLPNILDVKEVLIVEGEKDADNLAALGFIATTCPMGAKKWRDEYNEYLRDKDIVLIPDNDPEGKEHMMQVATSLNSTAKSLKWLDLPNLPNKGDISDWMTTCKNKDEAIERLSTMITELKTHIPQQENTKEIDAGVSARVREYLLDESDGGIFKLSDLKRELGFDNNQHALARNCVRRMVGQGLVQKHGQGLGVYRVIDKKKDKISWDSIEAKPSGLKLPGNLHRIVTIRHGDMVCFAGFKNHNKTAIAIETVKQNLNDFVIHLFITEYKARMKRRLLDFDIDLNHPNLNTYQIERGDYIPDKIEPGEGVLNIIDHFPNLDNFYLVGKYQDEIHRALNGALCVVTHQKKEPRDKHAIGGSFWTITPTLAVTLYQAGEKQTMEIRKGKEPGEGIYNPNDMTLNYELKRGCQFSYDKAGWKSKHI